MPVRIGSRKSSMAVRQAEIVAERLMKAFPEEKTEIVKISSTGDKHRDRPLTSFGSKGVFVKELEEALLRSEIDMAVHSAKDMPSALPEGLHIGAVLPRDYAADMLISRFPELPEGAVIGTGSPRRELQLREIYPLAVIKPIRGNVETRIEKMLRGEYDAVMLAQASVYRMGINEIPGLYFTAFAPESFIPAAGQGFIAVEAVKGRAEKYLAAVSDAASAQLLRLEREFLFTAGAGCHEPAGAYAEMDGSSVVMRTLLYKNGKKILLCRRGELGCGLGKIMAEESLAKGE